jgi:cell wall-associated NlpC family hydrolase
MTSSPLFCIQTKIDNTPVSPDGSILICVLLFCLADNKPTGMRNYLFLFLLIVACKQKAPVAPEIVNLKDSTLFSEFSEKESPAAKTDSSLPQKIVAFAKTLIGVPYKYCSMTPGGGFDCSGFVNYVFNHFSIAVPRSSVDFTNAGEEVELNNAQAGDLILFTGTNPHSSVVGHIGIVTANEHGDISFIQSTSGAAYGVVVSKLDESYKLRFVKVIRIVK